MDYSKLRYETLQRFGFILRELCDGFGISQGKLSKEAKRLRKQLVKENLINPGDLIGSMEQPAISRVLAGVQEPTYFQVLIWLQVVREHYDSDDFAQKCEELGIEKPPYSGETEGILWGLTGFREPKEIIDIYKRSQTIQPIQYRMLDHRETRLNPKQNIHLPRNQQSGKEKDTDIDLPALPKTEPPSSQADLWPKNEFRATTSSHD